MKSGFFADRLEQLLSYCTTYENVLHENKNEIIKENLILAQAFKNIQITIECLSSSVKLLLDLKPKIIHTYINMMDHTIQMNSLDYSLHIETLFVWLILVTFW